MKELKLTLHQSLKERFSKVKLIITQDYPPSDYFGCGSMELVSGKLRNLLTAELDAKAEFFPVEIFYRNHVYTERKFFYLNVIDKIDCFDFQNSIYSVDEEIGEDCIESIEKLVLHPVDLNKHKLFYITKVGFSILCIAEALADKIVTAGYTGMKFLDPLETTW